MSKAAQSPRTPGRGGGMIFLGFRARIFVFMRTIMGRGVGHPWSYPLKKVKIFLRESRRVGQVNGANQLCRVIHGIPSEVTVRS